VKFRTQLVATLTLLAALTLHAAQKNDPARVMFEAAKKKELVDGDLNGAIKQYKDIVSKFAGDHAIAADALIRMADCYQRLGDAESRKIYERVLHDYADQKEAVNTARARLGGGTATGTGIVTRQVWTGPKVDSDGTVSADGRYLSFVDWETGDLAIHDLMTGADRRLTNKGSWSQSYSFAQESVISPDGRQIAYTWFSDKTNRYELRLMGLNGANVAAPKVLYDNEDVDYIPPLDWSRDGKWIAVGIRRRDKTSQIGLIDSNSGSLRVLKSLDWQDFGKLSLSPDGQYLAFNHPSEDGDRQDIFVLATDGSREIPAVIHATVNAVIGWTPDGKKLLFSSNRSGSISIYAIPFSAAGPQAAPELIKSDVGRINTLGLTRSGSFYFDLRVGGPDVYVTSVDFDSGRVLTPPAIAAQHFVGHNRQPAWSSDGKYLAYATIGNPIGGARILLNIQSVDTGRVRTVRPQLSYFQQPRWSPDDKSLLVQGTDLKGRQGVYKVDVQTGDAEAIVEGGVQPRWSPEGKKFFYTRRERNAPAATLAQVIERDLASGNERVLLRKEQIEQRSVSVSPDGRNIAVAIREQTSMAQALIVLPLAGGEPRELLRTPVGFRFTAWTPDGRFILFTKVKSPDAEDSEIWMIPAAGGEPRKIDIGTTRIVDGLSIQPGTGKIAFSTQTGENTDEVWVMENFLAGLKPAK
jgi:Tol biopolymer transport system component